MPLAGEVGEGKVLAPVAGSMFAETVATTSSSCKASLLGAGVRLWLDPRAVLDVLVDSFRSLVLFKGPGVFESLVGTLDFAADASTALVVKKLLMDLWLLFDCDPEADFFNDGEGFAGEPDEEFADPAIGIGRRATTMLQGK